MTTFKGIGIACIILSIIGFAYGLYQYQKGIEISPRFTLSALTFLLGLILIKREKK